MAHWFRFYAEALDDIKVQKLPGELFKRKFLAAMEGEKNEFDSFLKPDYGRPSAKEWARIRRAIFERDDFTCRYCGQRGRKLECDHVIPVSRGGESVEDNLVTACYPCNRNKGKKTPEEWQRGLV